jgi:hypothetical protein
MRRLGLAFSNKTAEELSVAPFGDIMLGVFVCANTYEDTCELFRLGRNSFGDSFTKWLSQVRKVRFLESDASVLFTAYLFDGYKRPPINRRPPSEGAIMLSAPWEQLLKCVLVAAGFSESEILNGYMPARWYDYYTVLELKQSDRCKPEEFKPVFFSKREAEGIEAIKEPNGN